MSEHDDDRWADQSAPTTPIRPADVVAPLRDELQRVKEDRDRWWDKAQALASENAELSGLLKEAEGARRELEEKLAGIRTQLSHRFEDVLNWVADAPVIEAGSPPTTGSSNAAAVPAEISGLKAADPFLPKPTLMDPAAQAVFTNLPAEAEQPTRLPAYAHSSAEFEEGTVEFQQGRAHATQLDSEACGAPAGFPSEESPGTDPDR